jgi:hypothetical protein
MMRTDHARLEALVAVGARPCAPQGYAWRQSKQGFTIPNTGTNSAHGLPGAPT